VWKGNFPRADLWGHCHVGHSFSKRWLVRGHSDADLCASSASAVGTHSQHPASDLTPENSNPPPVSAPPTAPATSSPLGHAPPSSQAPTCPSACDELCALLAQSSMMDVPSLSATPNAHRRTSARLTGAGSSRGSMEPDIVQRLRGGIWGASGSNLGCIHHMEPPPPLNFA